MKVSPIQPGTGLMPERGWIFHQTNMTYEVKLNGPHRTIEITFTGVLTSEDIRESTEEGMALHLQSDVNCVLIDDSNLESVEEIFDLYDLPKQYAKGGARRSARIALVMPKGAEAREAAQFYSDVCFNRGWVVETFECRDEAVEWLESSESQ